MNTSFIDCNTVKETAGWESYASGIAWGTVALFIAIVAGYGLLLTGIVQDFIPLGWGTLISTVLAYLSFTVMHEAGHGNISHGVNSMKIPEQVMGWLASAAFLVVPYQLFAKIHDYHHAYTNDPDRDPDFWVSGDNAMQVILRAFLLPFHYLYRVATDLFEDPILRKTHKSSLIYFIISAIFSTAVILSGYGLELLFIGFIPVLLGSFVLGMVFDWIPHHPTHQQGRYQNTRVYMFPGLSILTCGQNYHLIHHLYPRVPWYNYQRVFTQLEPELRSKNAPIEQLFTGSLPGIFKAPSAHQPGPVGSPSKLSLTVSALHKETADSVVITFANLDEVALEFKPGQYLTLSKKLNNEYLTRCYSICEANTSGKLSVAVKRVDGGLLSSYLNEELVVGDQLTVAGPFGEFIYQSCAGQDENLVLIAGGSGITPIISILESALIENPDIHVHLIYTNRSIADTLFNSRLNQLLQSYPDTLEITPVYQTVDPEWSGLSGYLDTEKLSSILAGQDADSQYYICGPARMKDCVLMALDYMGVSNKNIFIEDFTFTPPAAEGPVHAVEIKLADGKVHKLDVAENQTVLQIAKEQGITIPHACGIGQCGCCMLQISSGSAQLAEGNHPGILPVEVAKGLTLSCQCKPTSALTLVEHIG
ncbi:MAG: fatty acid desaturase [Proteobacteria bacterium]|nr:fatty acid desaturase [Pseudomonadota bacterium]